MSNYVCLQKKQDGRRGKNADGQIENNGASTPVIISPCYSRNLSIEDMFL